MFLEAQVAIVTGASRGIGRAVARELAAQGAAVVINYVNNAAAAAEIAAEIAAAGGQALAVAADVSKEKEANALIDQTLKAFGRLDILVNNAGITRDALVLRMKTENWQEVLATNLNGAFYCARAALKPMLKQRRGRIINITSVVGLSGNPGQANYAAAKAGLIGFTKSVALEVADRGITVNAVAPGYITTDMTASLAPEVQEKLLAAIPVKRLGQPEDVAGVVSFLASPAAGYLTGQVISVDGGMPH